MTSALERGAVRVAIIGCGSMGLLGHLPACQAEGIEVVAAVDPMPARLAMFRDAAGLTDADCATDPAEVLDRSDIDAVIVASPPAFRPAKIGRASCRERV